MKKSFRLSDKGFSLVELIIVIAIMAVLVGVVGAQVIPYMNNSKKAKDIQILSAIATAGVSAYSFHADSAENVDTMVVTIEAGTGGDVYTCDVTAAQNIADEMKNLVSNNYVTDAHRFFESKEYRATVKIFVTFDFENGHVEVVANDGAADIYNDNSILGRL